MAKDGYLVYERRNQKKQPERISFDINSEFENDEKLFSLLQKISYKFRSLYEGSGSQKNILTYLYEKKSVTQKELTEYLNIKPASVSEVVGKLEKNGLIVKTRSQKDHRTIDLTITEEGKSYIKMNVGTKEKRHAAYFNCFEEEEKKELIRMLEILNYNTENIK